MSDIHELLDKTKVGFMMKGNTFLITIAFNMKHEFDDSFPTAATNGLTTIYNPDWFKTLTPAQRIGLMAHEVWHVALDHIGRGKGKDKEIYNMAGDYVINLLLVQAGFELPPEGLLDYKYHGWSTEEVYEDLIQNPQNQKPTMMDIIPANGDSEEDKKIQQQITEVLVKALTQQRLSDEAGHIPEEITRVIDKLIQPKMSWSDVLEEFITEKMKEDYSFKRPNRRYPDIIVPSMESQNRLQNITIAIDTSGSISDPMIQAILTEIKYIHDIYKPEKLKIIDCDCSLNNIYEIDEYTDIMDLKFTGGGGTSFTPVMIHCENEKPTVLVYFTDLYAKQVEEEQGYPIIWVCYSDHPPAPIGTTVYYEYQD